MNERYRLSLDGLWKFQIDPSGEKVVDDVEHWREARVPLPWQAQFDDLRHYSGVAFYRRTIHLEREHDGAAILHFGAVDYQATVWINGVQVGKHEGGYLPFEFDVSPMLHAGKNDLVVRVVDPDDDRSRWPEHPFSEVPHGKQSWYGPIGGLWQSVWLELRPSIHIRSLRLTPDPNDGSIAVDITLNREDGGVDRFASEDANSSEEHEDTEDSLAIEVRDDQGNQVADTTLPGLGGQVMIDEAIALWSPDSPALYTVTVRLLVEGDAVDEIDDTCGFRTIDAKDGRIYLNGEPVYLRGALDQAYYPETIYTPPSTEYLEDQARKAKELGLNCLRIHIKIEDPRYYEVADRLGLLVWTEIPNWAHLSDEAGARARETFRCMVERDWNRPSIIAWTLVNEDWGTDLSRNPEHRRWLAEFYEEAKRIDPTRLIVDNSACHGNLHVASDLEDYHHYRAIPDHAAEWDAWLDEFVNRAGWCWADDYEQHRRADLPLLVSEFGNWGLPDPKAIQEDGGEPWWFETGYERGGGIVYPHGIQERFLNYGLDELFGSLDDLAAQHQRHMAKSLAYEIGSMRLRSRIGGYVITELTDVHWECNGLFDMQRNVKQNLEEFVALNQDNVVVVRPQCWSGRPGETLPVNLRAFGVDGPAQEGTIHWQAGDARGDVPAPGDVVRIPLPDQPGSGMLIVQARWLSEDGTQLAEGMAEVAWVTPFASEDANGSTVQGQTLQERRVEDGEGDGQERRKPVLHVAGDDALAEMLAQVGYEVTDATDQTTLLISRRYTEALQSAVQQGAHLLLLAGTGTGQSTEEMRLPVGKVIQREGTGWQGDWATSFSWLKKRGPFRDLPGDPFLEMEYAEIMPDAVLVGLPSWALKSHSWANLALGWIHKPVSLLATMPYGRGQITVSTFKLSNALLAEDVIAGKLLEGMVRLAGRA